jgi:glucose-1-phosphate thymidylyltransferase
MNALILCGGYGTRLLPLTAETPKPLLKLQGRPMIDYTLENLAQTEVERTHIITNVQHYAIFQAWAPAHIQVHTEISGRKPGGVTSLQAGIEQGSIDDDLLVIGGADIFMFNLQQLIDFFREKKTFVGAVRQGPPARVIKSSEVILDSNGRITYFREKPLHPTQPLISACCYILPKEKLSRVKEFLHTGNPSHTGNLFEWLIRREPVYGFYFTEKWWDVNTLEEYTYAQANFYK